MTPITTSNSVRVKPARSVTRQLIKGASRTAPERGCVEDQPQQLRKTGLLNMLEPQSLPGAAAGALHTAALQSDRVRRQCKVAPVDQSAGSFAFQHFVFM